MIALTQQHATHAASGAISNLDHSQHWPTTTTFGTTIRSKLIPALTGQPPASNEMRDLLALPARLGGMALIDPISVAYIKFSASCRVSN